MDLVYYVHIYNIYSTNLVFLVIWIVEVISNFAYLLNINIEYEITQPNMKEREFLLFMMGSLFVNFNNKVISNCSFLFD